MSDPREAIRDKPIEVVSETGTGMLTSGNPPTGLMHDVLMICFLLKASSSLVAAFSGGKFQTVGIQRTLPSASNRLRSFCIVIRAISEAVRSSYVTFLA